ncbi:MAG: GNAT family N-acetyltransferase [Bacteroidetes bacterium]|nr:GNAT family N-acetyltransferase [Bacteroidota bacterium]
MNTPKINTDRLILRGIKSNDIFGYSEIFSDQETMELFGGPITGSDLEMIDVVQRMQKERENNISYFWSIVPIVEKEFAGFIRLMNYQSGYFDLSYQSMGEHINSPEFRKHIDREGWEVDYALLKRFRGYGYMSEALNSILKFANDEYLSPIYAKVNSMENLATIKVLKKNEFSEVLPQMSKGGKIGMIYKKE